jgi:hypothetical protein
LFLFLHLFSVMLVDGFYFNERWRLIDLWNSMQLLGSACLGMDHERIEPFPQPEFYEAALTLGVVCLLCLIYLNRRTRGVEIVR